MNPFITSAIIDVSGKFVRITFDQPIYASENIKNVFKLTINGENNQVVDVSIPPSNGNINYVDVFGDGYYNFGTTGTVEILFYEIMNTNNEYVNPCKMELNNNSELNKPTIPVKSPIVPIKNKKINIIISTLKNILQIIKVLKKK